MSTVRLLVSTHRRWPWMALTLGGLLIALSLVCTLSAPQRTAAANTVLWSEVAQPAESGTFAAIAFGDLNEDGHLDLVGGSLGLGVWATAGDGTGSWTPMGALVESGTYYGLALGDVNGDGKLDVVGAENGTGIHIWLGDGAGGWSTMTSPLAAGVVWGVALGDVNRDGKLDIVAGSGANLGLRAWTGDGAGAWTAASTGLPVAGTFAALAVGDVDRDGRPDLVAASRGTGMRAWRNAGISWTERSAGLPASGDFYGVALGDLDNDGDLDVLASGENQGVQAWTGSGGTVWSWTVAATGLPASGDYWGVAVGDVNNDGRLDVAAGGVGSGPHAWLGDGGGTWDEQSSGLPTTDNYYGVALGDLDDDGMHDLAASTNAGVRAWRDAGTPDVLDGWLQIASPTTTGLYEGLDVGDLNNDGLLDVVAASDGTGIQLWTGDGGNTWEEIAAWTSPDLPTTGTYRAVAFGDINLDGALDVVAGSGGDKGVQAWLFMDRSAWIERFVGLPDSGEYLDIALGDLDNDGDPDILAGSSAGIGAWTAEDFDTLSPWWDAASAGLPGTGTYPCVAFGDLDDDGMLDVAAGSEGSGLRIWRGNGAGAWTAQPAITAAGTWRDVALGDVNDDGLLDVVAAAEASGVRAWAGDGAFGWTALTAPAANGSYHSVALGDVNNDGKLDVVAGPAGDAGLQVWAGDGGKNWLPFAVNLPTTGDYVAVAWGEIDNDGALDLIAAKYGGGSVHAWTGAEGAPPSGWAGFAPTGWISTTQKADCTVQVRDTGAGLDVDSAEHSFLGSAGTWSTWQAAGCSGTDGVTTTQTISVLGVPFSRDSGPGPTYGGTAIRFRIADMMGNVGYSDEYPVYIDTTPPINPTSFPDSSHWPGGGCETDTTIRVDWDGASDATSGLDGYSYAFGTSYTLPDTLVDTWVSAGTSDPLADGRWYVYVRTRDEAGNWASDAASDGPYCIDTGPPTNPTTYMTTPPIESWTTDNTVQVTWSGAEDLGSGVFGYSFYWSQSASSVPDLVIDTTGTSTTSSALPDGDNWFHIRTRDGAGNWSDAAHWGRFRIDRTAPLVWLTTPARADSASFTVTWTGSDTGSGVDGYDVQSSDDGVTWENWLEDVSSTSDTFDGERGRTYFFRVRARDNVGNQSAWSDPDEVFVGRDVTVRVEDEAGTPLSGATVYRNGWEMGDTSAAGTLVLPNTLLDDELAAKYLIEQVASSKGRHDLPYGAPWAYRTYITSVDHDATGNPLLHSVSNVYTTQTLTVRPENPLVGFHVLFSVQWDADATFLTELRDGLQSASTYLYDLTDGQMLWEYIEIEDSAGGWRDADYRIHASNTEWPRGHVGGILDDSAEHVYLGRYFDGQTSNSGTWDRANGYRTTIHEFGHYGLFLYDEYEDEDGGDSQCTTDIDDNTVPASERACFMDSQYRATEMCSILPDHPHNADTEQHAIRGEPCWESVRRRFRDDGTDRWIIETAYDRGSIMPGPTSIAVSQWMLYQLGNWDTGVCAPWEWQVLDPSGDPLVSASVWIETPMGLRLLTQGHTDADGRITILGAHDGDLIVASWFGWYSALTFASCPGASAHTTQEAAAAQQTVATPNAFDLDVRATPGGVGGVLQIEVTASAALSEAPHVLAYQEGVEAPIEVAVAYDGGSETYVGTAVLSTSVGLEGNLWCQATDTEDNTVTILAPFNVEHLSADDHARLMSGDGLLELALKPGSLPGDAAVTIMPTGAAGAPQDDLVVVSGPYEVSVSTGVYTLSQPAVINMYYHAEAAAGVSNDTMEVYHWDAGSEQWVSDGGRVDPEHSLVSAQVDHLSVFAILAERERHDIYLPLIARH